MLNLKKTIYSLPILIFIGLSLLFWKGLSLHPQELPSSKIGKPLPVFCLPMLPTSRGLSAGSRHLSTSLNPADKPRDVGTEKSNTNCQHALDSTQLKHRFTLLNVWASWCESCQAEQAFLLMLAEEGMSIVGINYKDTPEAAKKWLAQWGNPYQSIGLDTTGDIGIELGVYGTPETFLIDPDGRIVYRYAGVLTRAVWDKWFEPKVLGKEG